MRTDLSKWMMEAAMNRSRRQMEGGDTLRALRQLADMGARYAGACSAAAFELLSSVLHTVHHPYREALQRLGREVAPEYLRAVEPESGFRFAPIGEKEWYAVFHLTGDPADTLPGAQEARRSGVRCFVFCTEHPSAEELHALCAALPGCRFLLMTEDAALTDALLDSLRDIAALTFAACRRAGAFVARTCLEQAKRLFVLCRRIGGGEMAAAVESGRLPEEEGLLVCYLPDQDTDPALQKAFDELVCRARMHPVRPQLPLIFPQDGERVQHMIEKETAALSAGVQVIGKMLKKLSEGSGDA